MNKPYDIREYYTFSLPSKASNKPGNVSDKPSNTVYNVEEEKKSMSDRSKRNYTDSLFASTRCLRTLGFFPSRHIGSILGRFNNI
ncbi:hypothetical protein PNOK_0595500 [Pyrrhoderma noxium]|uniref:Uncharacterized protein n=1 Tax=Pyrrhoderma noxium TaxID=2282107 RepID=A0A286UHN1_9AGAM|nr:hypothetical protein PNOK_0595500 [Pyrrhoderma noxium]